MIKIMALVNYMSDENSYDPLYYGQDLAARYTKSNPNKALEKVLIY